MTVEPKKENAKENEKRTPILPTIANRMNKKKPSPVVQMSPRQLLAERLKFQLKEGDEEITTEKDKKKNKRKVKSLDDTITTYHKNIRVKIKRKDGTITTYEDLKQHTN